jgi:hypothetical protein
VIPAQYERPNTLMAYVAELRDMLNEALFGSWARGVESSESSDDGPDQSPYRKALRDTLYGNVNDLKAFLKAHKRMDLMPVQVVDVQVPHEVPLKSLGCGFFGCVFATKGGKSILKITADESEARAMQFANYLRSMGNKLDGIGFSPFVLKLEGGVKHQDFCFRERNAWDQHLYAYWREEFMAIPVGGDPTVEWAYKASALRFDNNEIVDCYEEQVRSVDLTRNWAEQFCNLWHTFKVHRNQQGQWVNLDTFLADVNRIYELSITTKVKLATMHPLDQLFGFAETYDTISRLVLQHDQELGLIDAFKQIDIYEHWKWLLGAPIVDTLKVFQEHRTICCDLHGGNCNYVERKGRPVLIITDPGMTVSGSSEFYSLEIPTVWDAFEALG